MTFGFSPEDATIRSTNSLRFTILVDSAAGTDVVFTACLARGVAVFFAAVLAGDLLVVAIFLACGCCPIVMILRNFCGLIHIFDGHKKRRAKIDAPLVFSDLC